MKYNLILLLLIMLGNSSVSQSIKPDTSLSPAYKNAVALYSRSLSEELHMYNGREYKGYREQFSEGTPYFITNKLSKGTLDYDGKVYENVSLLYDAAKDELICLYFDNASSIKLENSKVAGFSIMDHHFIYIKSDSSQASPLQPGFYDELYRGVNSLLAKRTKNIQTFLRQSAAEIKVFSKDHYYLLKENNYYTVSNKKLFLQHFSDKRKELQQYIKQNRLNFKKDFENAMTKTLSYYDQLIK